MYKMTWALDRAVMRARVRRVRKVRCMVRSGWLVGCEERRGSD